MLEPSRDRLDYTEILRKPAPGFELSAAIASTYSLDLQALLAALLPLGFEGDAASECRNNPVFALHALKKLLPKLALFCDGASIKVPNLSQNRLLALLDRAVYPVKHKTAFHPKFWLLKFVRGNEVCYRLVVLSKNVTFDRSWDMAIALDGVPDAENANGSPLADMLQFLHRTQWGKGKRLSFVSKMIDEIRNVAFGDDEMKARDLRFIPLGIDKIPAEDEFLLNKKAAFYRLLVISPFLSAGAVRELFARGRENSETILISRKLALSELSAEDLVQVNCFCMKDEVIDGERSENLSEKPLQIQTQDIHAKFYLFQQSQGSSPYLYLGSANLTQNGINSKNVELLVRFKLSRQNIYDKIRADLLPQNHNGVFTPYQCPDVVKKSDAEIIRDELEKSYRTLTLGKFSAEVTKCGDKFNIELCFSGKISPGYRCEIAPLLGNYQTLSEKVIFKEQVPENISDFYRVKLELEKSGEKIERLLIIDTLSNIDTLADIREELLEKFCLKKSEDLLEYLSYVLSENAYPLAVAKSVQAGAYNGTYRNYQAASFALYEKMLYWAATDKSRLLEIKDIIQHRNIDNRDTAAIIKLCETFYRAAGGGR